MSTAKSNSSRVGTISSRIAADVDAYLRTCGISSKPTSIRRGIALATTPILWSLLVHRCAHSRLQRGRSSRYAIGWLASGACLSVLTWITNVANKTVILGTVDMDGGVTLSPRGHIILGARRVGRGTSIGERVTIGQSLVGGGLPEIGEKVAIGADSVIYGLLTIGDGAVLLPGTVLTRSIPGGVVVQGNPARLVDKAAGQAQLVAASEVGPGD